MNTETQNRLLDVGSIKRLTGFKSTTSVYTLMRERDFPKPIAIGRTNRWVESEVQGWISQQIQSSRGGAS